MTEKLYETDAYRAEFDALVSSCAPCGDGWEVCLDRTAFYPEEGGQPCDRGFFLTGENIVPVTDVQEQDGEILHRCGGPLEPGSRVKGRIDWERRIAHMRDHSGEHILSGILCSLYGLRNIGFHMGKDCVTVDFDGLLTEEQLQRAETLANAKVLENVRIETSYPDPETLSRLHYRSKKEIEGPVRIVSVPGADTCACCGTHVRRTGEVGPIRIAGSEHYKNGIRLTVLIGEKALADYAQKSENNRKISTLLSVKPAETAAAVEKLLESYNRLKMAHTGLKLELLERKVEEIPAGCPQAVLFEEGLSPADIRRLADRLQEKTAFAAVFAGDDESGYRYVICSACADAVSFGKEFNGALHGRGGGRNPMIQGSVKASRREIEEFLARKGLG